MVVLPDDSGPKISMMRPRGTPLPPKARSMLKAPVEIPSISRLVLSPSCMIAPLPNCFSICCRAPFNSRSLRSAMAFSPSLGLGLAHTVHQFIYHSEWEGKRLYRDFEISGSILAGKHHPGGQVVGH